MRTLTILAVFLLPMLWVTGAVLADESELVYRSFDVSDLVTPAAPSRGPHLGMRAPQSATPERARLAEPSAPVPAEYLLDLVRESVHPESWDTVPGAFIDLRQSLLHVRNHKDAMAKVEALLFDLAAQAAARALFSVDVVEGSAKAYPAAGEGTELCDSASLELPFGVRRFLQATNRVQFVVDYDPEIAQGSNIGNPTLLRPLEGLVTDVMVHPTRDASRVVVEALVQQGRYREGHTRTLGIDEEYIAEPFRSSKRWHLGTLECPLFEHVQMHITAVAAPGQVVSVPVARYGRQQTFQLRADGHGGGTRGPLLGVGAITSLTLQVRLSELPPSWGAELSPPQILWDAGPHTKPFWQVENLLHLATRVVEPGVWEDGRGQAWVLGSDRIVLHGTPDLRKKVESFLAAREAELLRPVVLDVRVYSVPDAVASGPSRAVDPAVAQLLVAGRLPTLLGRRASLMAGSTQNYLADYDVEVAQEARISDPIIGLAFDGLLVSLLPRASIDGRMLPTEVEMVYAVRRMDEEPFESGAQTLGPIDRIQVDRTVVRSTFRLPANGTYLIDGGRDPRDPKRRLAIELRADLP